MFAFAMLSFFSGNMKLPVQERKVLVKLSHENIHISRHFLKIVCEQSGEL